MGPNYQYDMLDVEERYRYEPTDHELAIADLIEEGSFDENGGFLGTKDWEEVLAGTG